MLKQLFICSTLFFSLTLFSQNFTTRWNTNNTESGSSANNQITIPTNPAFTYNYTVAWGDGTTDTNVAGNITHDYAAPGIYTIEISGTFPSIYFNDENANDKLKILEILDWGNIQWQSMENSFYGCENLNFDAIAAPDLTQVTTLRNMFRDCTSFNGILNNWDVSTITDISGLFARATIFNRPLDLWNTINVTDMSETFSSANNFNEPLDNWNTASVTTMNNMFSSASRFNQNISNWDVSQVTDMSGTFRSTGSFDQPLNNWNVSSVTDMSFMFNNSRFNQTLDSWNVDNVTTMRGMFGQAQFNQPIGNWNVSSVEDMSEMFQRNRTFNQPLNGWDVSNVTNMSSMFDGWFWDQVYNQPLNNWDVSNVTDMAFMFRDNSAFNQDISGWDVGNVTDMEGMFQQTDAFNQNISIWNVSNVENMRSMFQQANAFNQPLNIWDISNVSNITSMFLRASDFNQPLNSWDVSNIDNLQNLFSQATSFNQDISGWNVSNVTNMSGTFNQASSFNQNLAAWSIVGVTNMTDMLSNSGISQENYDNILIGWAAQGVLDNVNLGASNLNYCDGRDARQELIDDHGWNISGDAVNCTFVLCTEITSPRDTDTQVPANSDIRWAPAPNATGYLVSIRRENGGTTEIIYDNEDFGNVVGIDFTNEFTPGDTIFVTVTPYNAEGPATGCPEISFTVVESWVNSPDAFKLTYDTTIQYSTFTTPVNQLLIETSPGETYDYSIDWGDGQYDNNVTADIVHTYLVPGIYTVSIIGTFPAPRHEEFNSDAHKLVSIDQWGTQPWLTMNGAFAGCENMEYNATDVPDLSNVTDMSRMFIVCRNFNGNINNWDVSNVTNMFATFGVASIYNQPLNNWNVSSVTRMGLMFFRTDEFNQDINNWDTSSVTDMQRMFEDADAFNQPLNSWDVSNVTDMHQMFQRTQLFNQPLNNWDVGNVLDMEEMFDGAQAFNQNIDSWDVSSVIGMGEMFSSAQAFNQPLNSWDVSSVDNMRLMFAGASVFNQPINSWDVSSVLDMNGMFNGASAFNQNIDSWNVTNVTDMSRMFGFATSFNQPLNSWDVNSVVNMSSMFRGAEVFNQPLSNWNVSAVANMSEMFEDAIVFNQPINSWDVSSVTLMESMFEDAEAFNQELNDWDVAVVTDFEAMFKNAVVFDNPLNNWNTGEALTMAQMFNGAEAFNQNIDSWNVSFVTTMFEMFRDASNFNQSLNSWNVASVNTMQGMFQNAIAFNGGINDWNVRGVTTMEDMFNGASNFNQSINNWRITAVSDMESMFENATAFNQSFESWSPGSVNMNSMFRGASTFDQYLGYWNIENVTSMNNMLDNTVLPRENYDNTLIDWSEQTLTAGITLGALGLPYCDAIQERQSIIDTFGWNIVGDVLDCPLPECTQLVTPLNGETDVPINTNLTWEDALYAESYDLTITINPSGTVLNESVTETSYSFADGVLSTGDTVSVLITPINSEGSAVGCATESFTISADPATVPECTALLSPLNNAVDIAVDTDLEWNPIANADGYRISVGTTLNGTEIVNDENVGNVTEYDFATDLPEDTLIYVTIVPYNEEGPAVTCLVESFRTEFIPVPPLCTELNNPLNGTTGVPIDTNISWNAVPDATGYLVIVGITQGGIEIANNIDVGNTTTYDFPTDLQEDRTHYVTIIPYNDVGDALACTEESFRTGNNTLNDPPLCTTLSNPLNGAIDVAIDTDLTWNISANTDGYRITAGTSSGGTDILNDEDVGNVTTYDLPADLPENTEIFVTIVPYNAFGDASVCTEESFTTETLPTVPICTNLITPLNGATNVSISTDLSWNVITNADGYFLTVGTTSGGNDILDAEDVVGNTFDLPTDLPENTEIFVNIVPYNGVGQATGCVEESFTTETVPTVPVCTNLSTPLNGATNVSISTDLSWNAIANADGYFLTVGTTSGGSDILDAEDVIGSTFDLPTDLPENTEIFVTLVPYNGVGQAAGCTEESFTTETVATAPICTNLSTPLNGATDVSIATDLTWNAVANADGYFLSVRDGTSSEYNILDNLDVGNVTTFDLPANLPANTDIYVLVVPYNGQGSALDCSEEFFVTGEIPETVPECTSLQTPLNLAIDVPTDTSLTWSSIESAMGYRITIGTAPGLGDILNNEDLGNTTAFEFSEGLPENTEIFVLIVPYNTIGDAVSCDEESFITGSVPLVLPECTTLAIPENGAEDVAIETDISWEAIENTTGYILNVGTSSGASDLIDNLDVGLSTTFDIPNELPFEQQIFVTIIPYNEDGFTVGCAEQSFTTTAQEELESQFGFSPDGDGNNDFWTINGIEQYPNNTVMIFNRWGDMVFKTDGYDNNSNVFRGEANQMTGMGAGQLPEGTYFFRLVLPEQHNLKTTQGFLVLKR